MGEQIQLRRYTAAEHPSVVGAPGELTVVTGEWSLRVHDGTTPGGHPIGGGGGFGFPGTMVVEERGYGQGSFVGSSPRWAHDDHTHGSSPREVPVPDHDGDTLVGSGGEWVLVHPPIPPVVIFKPVYWGYSTLEHLTTEAQVKGLVTTPRQDSDYLGTHVYGATDPLKYPFVAWPQSFSGPAFPGGFLLGSGFGASMADASVGYGQAPQVRGYDVERVTVNAEAYLVYRLKNQTHGPFDLISR